MSTDEPTQIAADSEAPGFEATGKWFVPRGAAWAVAMIMLLELLAWTLPASCYDRFGADVDIVTRPDYPLISAAINASDVPDILVIGSSRARESVVVPELETALQAIWGRPIETASFAAAGCEIETVAALIDRLEVSDQLPEWIIYPVNARQLRTHDPPHNLRMLLVSRETLPMEVARNGRATESDLTPVIGNSWAFHLSLLRFSVRYRVIYGDLFATRDAVDNNSVRGGLSAWQAGFEERPRRLSERPRTEELLEWYVGRVFPSEPYLGDAQTALFADVMRRLSDAGVNVLVVEIPQSEPLSRHMPEGLVEDARARFADGVRGTDARFVSVAEHGLLLDDSMFREQSHLNLDGARAFTALIVELMTEAEQRSE